MKALLRKYQGQYYVWKPVEWTNLTYYLIDDDGARLEINQNEIVAIDENIGNGYVVCQHCNKLIKNDPESIEAHFKEEEAKRDCIRCKHLTTGDDKNVLDATLQKNDDGTYKVTQTFIAALYCKMGWYAKLIDSRDAVANCEYMQCRKRGVAPIADILIKYPGVFEKLITVDTLISKKCENERYINGYFEYDLKCRGSLKACVNEMGVVDHFKLYYRGYVQKLYYSSKYNMLFISDSGCYRENMPYFISDKKCEQIKEKLASLYKEANK